MTSGGDGPGMNAAIRSVVRYSLHFGLEVAGIMRGYQGLLEDDIVPMNHRSVSNIINRGGTILKTARSKDFSTDEGKAKAAGSLATAMASMPWLSLGGMVLIKGPADCMNCTGSPPLDCPAPLTMI